MFGAAGNLLHARAFSLTRQPPVEEREWVEAMRLRIGYQYDLELERPGLVVAQLNIHPSKAGQLEHPDVIRTTPALGVEHVRGMWGNWRARIHVPAGRVRIGADTVGLAEDSGGLPAGLWQASVDGLPDDAVEFLMASRYADFDRLLNVAWGRFGGLAGGSARVEAICDFAGTLEDAPSESGLSAAEVLEAGRGTLRDRTHVAIALCRAMNIPARYCSGYLAGGFGDAFDAWMEVYVGGRWHAVDAGPWRGPRLLVARGRDALDVEPFTLFGPGIVRDVRIWAGEVAAHDVAETEFPARAVA